MPTDETTVFTYDDRNTDCTIVRCDISCEQFLGAGTSGSVKSVAATSAIDGQPYAVKTVDLPDGGAPPKHVLAECQIHASLPASQSIVRYHYSWQTADQLHILLERVDGELWDALTEPEARLVDATERLGWIRDLLSAVVVLHASGVAHRDISPWNCFLASSNNATEPVQRRLKLGDFGLACRVPRSGSDASRGGIFGMTAPEGYAPLDESAVGSLYSAPELGAETGYEGKEVDVFSAGMTIFATWHAVMAARHKANAWKGNANLPRKQVQSHEGGGTGGEAKPGAAVDGAGVCAPTAEGEEVVDAELEAVTRVELGWEDELTACVEKLKADGKSLPLIWREAGPMADLVRRMVSHDAQSRPTAEECLELLGRVTLPGTTPTGGQGGDQRAAGGRSHAKPLLRRSWKIFWPWGRADRVHPDFKKV